MGLFKLHYNNKTNIIIITALLWAINFRTTFKYIYAHMGLGSFAVLRIDPILILIKNIVCSLYIIGFILELRANKSLSTRVESFLIQKEENNKIYIELKQMNKTDKNYLLNTVNKSHNLVDWKHKILFWIKVGFITSIIYFTEELYFCISNNHVLDRVIVPIRNFGILIALSIFSPLLIKKSCKFYKHQYIPYIIIFLISIAIVYYNFADRERFLKKFGSANTLIYIATYFLTGLESTLIKYLVDKEYISIFLILGLKGIIGTIVFTVINILFNPDEFYSFFENVLSFEYYYLNEPFHLVSKILYVLSFILLVYFKMYTIQQFSENHILSTLMIVDLIYFPLYIFERLVTAHFTITTPSSFIINSVAGIVNFFLMLIFNEILELKFWGLNTNLISNINKRQKKDYDQEEEDDIGFRSSENSINSDDESFRESVTKSENLSRKTK